MFCLKIPALITKDTSGNCPEISLAATFRRQHGTLPMMHTSVNISVVCSWGEQLKSQPCLSYYDKEKLEII